MTNPWFEAFRRGPEKAVADLFSGRAGVGSSMRLDTPELLYQAFPPTLADERAQLDDALLSWLHSMRQDYASQVKRLGFPAYGKRVGDCLIALQLLDLPEAKSRMRADLGAWLRWLLPLRLAPERDPALECFRLLTRDSARRPPHGSVATPRCRSPTGVPDGGAGWASVAAERRQRSKKPDADAAGAVAPRREDPPRS